MKKRLVLGLILISAVTFSANGINSRNMKSQKNRRYEVSRTSKEESYNKMEKIIRVKERELNRELNKEKIDLEKVKRLNKEIISLEEDQEERRNSYSGERSTHNLGRWDSRWGHMMSKMRSFCSGDRHRNGHGRSMMDSRD